MIAIEYGKDEERLYWNFQLIILVPLIWYIHISKAEPPHLLRQLICFSQVPSGLHCYSLPYLTVTSPVRISLSHNTVTSTCQHQTEKNASQLPIPKRHKIQKNRSIYWPLAISKEGAQEKEKAAFILFYFILFLWAKGVSQ